ncbi:unnamed protein product [Urochloa humidicola]
MDEESIREFQQGLRQCQDLLQQSSSSREADAQVLLHAADDDVAPPSAGEHSAEAPRNHDDSPGHLQDPRVRAIMDTLYNDDNDFLGHADNSDDREYNEEENWDGYFHPLLRTQDFIRFTETWDQGFREEAYDLLSQLVEPDVLERVREALEFTRGLADAEDDDVIVLERVNEAVADGRLLVQVTPARSLDESYGGGGGSRGVPVSSAVIASLEKQKYQKDLGDDHHTECPICLEDYAPGDDLTVMPCTYMHRYHQGCLVAWLERDNVCPLCRHALPTDTEQGNMSYGLI